MKTYLDCIPCFLKQALEASRKCDVDDCVRKKIMDEAASAVPGFSLESSPPEMARIIHRIVKKHAGDPDPYRKIKQQSNAFALNVLDRIKDKISKSPDRLLTAVELAIAGNIIDFGVKNTLDVEGEIEKILQEEQVAVERENRELFNFDLFRETLRGSKTVLYLADNAGETVFDRMLIDEIKRDYPGKEIVYAVKESPIINDALKEDAEACGIDKEARVISSGSDAPGTILEICSNEFRGVFRDADIVISKGQGNFETLSSCGRPVFYLFMAKCPVVAGDAGCDTGDILLLFR